MEVSRHPVSVPTRPPGGRTNAYVIGADPALLLDPAGRSDALDRAVQDRTVGHICCTHTHPDHVGALEHYARETDGAVWALRGRASSFERATGVRPDRTIGDGGTLPCAEGLEIRYAPGHASDHVIVHAKAAGVAFVGDCAVDEGSVVVGAPDGVMRAYLTTLRRLRAWDLERLYPGHGPVIDDPEATLERLLAHRLAREERVKEAVEERPADLEGLLERAYDKDLTGVEDLARATVMAHLAKLEREGRVCWEPAPR